MEQPERVRVRVVYALPERQPMIDVELKSGASVADAVAASGLTAEFPEIASRPLQCAVYGRVVTPEDPVRDGDRVEILRPLIADPKENRRAAAARNPIGRSRKF